MRTTTFVGIAVATLNDVLIIMFPIRRSVHMAVDRSKTSENIFCGDFSKDETVTR